MSACRRGFDNAERWGSCDDAVDAEAAVLQQVSVLVTGEVSRVRLCRDHGEIFFWLSLLRALVWVVYDAGSPGGCSGGAGSCDPIQISVQVGSRGAGCSPDGVGG